MPNGKTITCKRCKVGGLHWQETDKGFRLFDEDKAMHDCGTTCKRCGIPGLRWKKTENDKMRLFHENGDIHVCQQKGM